MRNVLFVISHHGSESMDLVESLNGNPKIVVYNVNGLYGHIDHFENLTSFPHKISDTSAIYGDHLLTNTTYYCEDFYHYCRFIYLLSPAKQALPRIVDIGYTVDGAQNYYKFRLHRMCEMIKRSPGSIVIPEGMIQTSLPKIEQYLGLKKPLRYSQKVENSETDIPSEVIDKSQQSYERFLYFIKQQDVEFVS